MDWSKISTPEATKLSRLHNFMYMVGGKNYIFEINEYPDGNFVGYAELTNDDSQQFAPANGSSIEECINNLVKNCA
jgi:hypothetical protein